MTKLVKKLKEIWNNAVIEIEEHTYDIIKRYGLLILVLILSITAVWVGLSFKESDVTKLNKLTEQMNVIENNKLLAISKVYPYYTDAEKQDKLESILRTDNEYRILNYQFKDIEVKEKSPIEFIGYGFMILIFSLSFSALSVFAYTKTDFSEEPKYLLAILAITFIPAVISFTWILTSLLK